MNTYISNFNILFFLSFFIPFIDPNDRSLDDWSLTLLKNSGLYFQCYTFTFFADG